MSHSLEKIRLHCSCEHPFQDAKYGPGIRVGAPVDKSRKNGSGRIMQAVCTVCGRLHSFNGQEVVAGANSGRG